MSVKSRHYWCFAGQNQPIIDELKDLNVNTKLISDGDVLGALYVSDPKYNVDMFMGIGGGPEGVLAASALDSYECHFQGRFIFDNEKDIQQANSMGIKDLDKKYGLSEIVKGDSIFCATGITDSSFIKGITFDQDKYISETLITHAPLSQLLPGHCADHDLGRPQGRNFCGFGAVFAGI